MLQAEEGGDVVFFDVNKLCALGLKGDSGRREGQRCPAAGGGRGRRHGSEECALAELEAIVRQFLFRKSV